MSAAGLVVGIALAALFVFDAIRLRGRWRGVLRAGDAPEAQPMRELVWAPSREGEPPDPALMRQAAALAHVNDLDAIDLVPERWSAAEALAFVQLTEPARGADRFAPGRTAGEALLLDPDVSRRASAAEDASPSGFDGVRFVRLAAEVKRCAARVGYVVAPGRCARRSSWPERSALFREVLGPAAPVALALPVAVYALVAFVCVFDWRGGLAALAAVHAQPLLVLFGAPVRCADLALYAALRAPWDLVRVVMFACNAAGSVAERHRAVEAQRPVYDALLANGLDRFFEPRRLDCPLCAGTQLTPILRMPDRIQHKPGRFTLERCAACGHIFQNPRLSIEGLAFYYRDFYDGLGEAAMETLFGLGREPYVARARMLQGHAETPRRWLDVGAGHGHFCLAAREIWPGAELHGLDLSDGVDIGVRRKWIDVGIRGLFPEKAQELRGRYDGVSMSHYLEHTRDPEAEISAAATVLVPGGHLLVEVPDPESRLRSILRSFWIPWFQPQHQHLVRAAALETILRRHGFQVVLWHRGEAHQRVDFLLAAFLLAKIAPSADHPWRARAGLVTRASGAVLQGVAFPAIVLGWVADRLAGPLLARAGWSNTYRVLARKVPGDGAQRSTSKIEEGA